MAYPVETYTKDSDATLDYALDWSSWLQTGETISVVVWTVPSGITKVSQSESTTAAVIWLSGGTIGSDYNVACKITTSAGRIDERTMRILVRSR
jgi:hypothetical protein